MATPDCERPRLQRPPSTPLTQLRQAQIRGPGVHHATCACHMSFRCWTRSKLSRVPHAPYARHTKPGTLIFRRGAGMTHASCACTPVDVPRAQLTASMCWARLGQPYHAGHKLRTRQCQQQLAAALAHAAAGLRASFIYSQPQPQSCAGALLRCATGRGLRARARRAQNSTRLCSCIA